MMMIRQRNEDDDYERIWKEVRTQPTLTLKRLSINQLIYNLEMSVTIFNKQLELINWHLRQHMNKLYLNIVSKHRYHFK